QSPISDEAPLTEKQIEHSKLFHKEAAYPNLREVSERGNGYTIVRSYVQKIDSGETPDLNDLSRYKGCQSDLVIVAQTQGTTSYLTDEEKAVFSEHQMSVVEVLKNGTSKNVETGDVVTVVQEGGKLRLKSGRTIESVDDTVEFLVKDKSYLLFL